MNATTSPLSAQDSQETQPVRGVLMVTGRADFGGGPEHVYQLAKTVSRSVPVYIAAPRDEPYWSRYQSLVGPARMLEIPHRRITPGAFARIVSFIRANDIDVVHAHGRSGGIYARPAALLAGVPCFYTPNGSTPVTSVRTAVYATAEYLLSTITRGVIAVSGTEAEALRPLCALRSRLNVINNGVEIPPHLDGPDTRLDNPLRIVHVTRFVYQKYSGLLLDIIESLREMRELAPFEFVILGDGPERAEFEAALVSRGLDHCVKVLGAVSNPAPYLSSAFCMVSTSRWEGLPLALLEAMARGVPVIASDVIGNKDAVADRETGFLFDLAEPRTAAQRLVELAHYPVLWKQMVRAARKRAEDEFSVQAMADATLRLYSRSPRRGAKVRSGAPGLSPAPIGVLHSFR